MIKIERQRELKKIIKGREFVSIADILKILNCSESTLRRDLKEMEKMGLLMQSQGVVIWRSEHLEHEKQPEMIYRYRQGQNVEIKRQLGAYAAQFIKESDTLFLDTGTTMIELAKQLPDIPLTVVTNDLQIAMELEEKYNVSTIILGGYVRRGTHTVIGGVDSCLESFHFQKAFFSPAGVDPLGEFMFFNLQAMDIRAKAHAVAEHTVMVVDHSKFGKKAFVKGFGFEDCDLLIADHFPNSEEFDWEIFLSSRIGDIRLLD